MCDEQVLPSLKNIAAIIITFHPGIKFRKQLSMILRQVDYVIIVDNNSGIEDKELLRTLESGQVEIIYNKENMGIAKALNQGINRARSRGYSWALTLDQDSIPLPKLVRVLIDAVENYPDISKVAVIGCNYFEHIGEIKKVTRKSKYFKCSYREETAVITSGSLSSISVYNKIGRFKDEYFIDCVDEEYCLRARTKGYVILMTARIGMIHCAGKPTARMLFGRKFISSNHSPKRIYYIFRNTLSLSRQYFLLEPTYISYKLFKWIILKTLQIVFLETLKIRKLLYAFYAVIDALLGRRRFIL